MNVYRISTWRKLARTPKLSNGTATAATKKVTARGSWRRAIHA